MLSGQKRARTEHNESMPSTKRSKVDNTALTDSWPQKHKMSHKQIGKLPSMMNPSFHKAVFQSFWNKKKFGAHSIEFNETLSKINKKQKMFQCRMMIINKQNKSQRLIVSSSNFDSKKKAEINVYQQFNYNYIPLNTLITKMKPYSFSNSNNLQDIITQKGSFLKSKTKTIIIEPVPLSTNEVDIIELIGIKSDDDMIQFIEFERDSDKAIYKKVYIEFNNSENATTFAEALNDKMYDKHKLSSTWTKDRDSKLYLKKSMYLKCVGFPLNITQNKVLQFLYQHKIEPIHICLIYKYSLISEIFLEFERIRDCVDALQITKSITHKGNVLYSRYSTQSEFEASMDYSKNIKKIHDELIRRSKCIDVMNVSWDTKEEQLMALFCKCGNIKKLHINHRRDLFAGTAFIQFEDEWSSEEAILTLNGYNMNGYNLKISMHLKQTKDDKKEIKQWYLEQEQQKIQNDKKRKANKAKKKKERAKRKRLRRAFRMRQ